MKRFLVVINCLVILLAVNAFADAKQTKTCEFSKRMLTKNPSCSQDLKDEAAKVDCTTGSTALDQMNQLQAKCVPQAQAKAGETSAKLSELKKADSNDAKLAEIKKRIEEKKAAKAAQAQAK